MNIQNTSQNVIGLILQYLSYYELKSIIFISKVMARKILHYMKGNLIELHCPLKLPDLSDFSKLSRLSIYLTDNKLKDVKHILQRIPKSILRLSLELDETIASQLGFYQCIPKYQPQLTHLYLRIYQRIQKIDCQILSISSILKIHKTFYLKMNHLQKLKVDTCKHKEVKINQILFWALFIKGQQPSIQSFQGKLTSSMFFDKKLKNDNKLQINTKLTSISLKFDKLFTNIMSQFDLRFQNNLNMLGELLGGQVNKLFLTLNDQFIMEEQEELQLPTQFQNLQCLFLRMPQYSLYSYQLKAQNPLVQFGKQQLIKLGLCRIVIQPSHYLQMLMDVELTTIDLSNTDLDDSCLDVISNYTNLKVLNISGCNKLSKQAIIRFMAKQKKLIKLNISGLDNFDQAAFKELNQNTHFQSLNMSLNMIDSITMLAILRRHCYSLTKLTFSTYGYLYECFNLAIKEKIVCPNLIKLSLCVSSKYEYSIRQLLPLFPNICKLKLKCDSGDDVNEDHLYVVLQILANTFHNNVQEIRICDYITNGFENELFEVDQTTYEKLRIQMPKLHTIDIEYEMNELNVKIYDIKPERM